jgi:hypothetical protein
MTDIAGEALESIELLVVIGVIGGAAYFIYKFETSNYGNAGGGLMSAFKNMFSGIGSIFN